jgi:hypothetical protein
MEAPLRIIAAMLPRLQGRSQYQTRGSAALAAKKERSICVWGIIG